jgi:hypothetical protein
MVKGITSPRSRQQGIESPPERMRDASVMYTTGDRGNINGSADSQDEVSMFTFLVRLYLCYM